MDISVLIPTFNRSETLRRTLLLYNDQEGMRDRFEVVVVDDGSTDGTPEMLRRLQPELAYPLRCFRLPGNSGPSAARNLALGEAVGDVVLITGDDILPDGRMLIEHRTWHVERHPAANVGVLGHVRWAAELGVTPYMSWLERKGAQFGYDAIRHGDAVDHAYLYTSNVSLKRAFVLASNELFDERLRFFEDAEWGARLAAKGLELRYNAAAVGDHLHPTALPSSLERAAQCGRSIGMLQAVNPAEFRRVTRDMVDGDLRVVRPVLKLLLHPAMARFVYRPLASLCERRVVADRIYALCHAAYFSRGLGEARAAGPVRLAGAGA